MFESMSALPDTPVDQEPDPVARELRTVVALRRRALERHAGEEAARAAGVALLDAAEQRALALLQSVETPHDPD